MPSLGLLESPQAWHLLVPLAGIFEDLLNLLMRVRPPQPHLTAGIASRVDLVQPVSEKAFHGQSGESSEGAGVAGAAATV